MYLHICYCTVPITLITASTIYTCSVIIIIPHVLQCEESSLWTGILYLRRMQENFGTVATHVEH